MSDATTIQTVAAGIQAAAAILFFATVAWEAFRRIWLREEKRRWALIGVFRTEFSAKPNINQTLDEFGGLFSARQIAFFNERLKGLGGPWAFPFKVTWYGRIIH